MLLRQERRWYRTRAKRSRTLPTSVYDDNELFSFSELPRQMAKKLFFIKTQTNTYAVKRQRVCHIQINTSTEKNKRASLIVLVNRVF